MVAGKELEHKELNIDGTNCALATNEMNTLF